jgi:hypothetical protein
MMGLSLKVTIGSLLDGVHIECKDMNELLEAQNAITEAGQNLKAHLATVRSFDGGESVVQL